MKKQEIYIVYDSDKHVILRIILDIELQKNNAGKTVLSICAVIKSRKYGTIHGQCLDYAVEWAPHIMKNKRFAFWYKMWKLYHLNDMHAGTQKQEDALQQAYAQGIISKVSANNYNECCAYLQSVGLYEVTYHNRPYRYGTSWLYRAIPKKDLEAIKSKMSEEVAEIKVRGV